MRCLTWAIVDAKRTECADRQGHGGMHTYLRPEPIPCHHATCSLNEDTDTWTCHFCLKEWS